MMNRLIILLSLLVCTVKLPAQSVSSGDILSGLKSYKSGRSSVTIHIDTLVEFNYYKHLLYNQRNPGAMGYQIRIFSGSGSRAREDAERASSLFQTKFDSIRADISYDPPDFKVYVGDCRTKSEQIKLYNRLKQNFPNAFPVYRRINVSYE